MSRRELEHFDLQMRDEFGETFTIYHQQYKNALMYTQTDQMKQQDSQRQAEQQQQNTATETTN